MQRRQKMKKLLVTILTLAMSAGLVLPLAACGGGDNPGGDGFTMTEGTDIRSLKSDKVTEQEWKAAFSEEKFDNFLCACTQAESYYITGRYDEKKADFKLYYGVDEGRTLMQHMLMVEEGGEVTAWNEIDGTWDRDGSYSPTSEAIPYYLRGAIVALKEQYSSFTYDEEKGCYTTASLVLIGAEAGADGGTSGVVIKDGTPCGVWMDVSAEDANGHPTTYPYDFIFYGFGEANIEASPNDGGDSSGGDDITLSEDTNFEELISDQVTEEEWRAIFSDEKFLNV